MEDRIEEWLTDGKRFYEQENYERSLELFREVLHVDPANVDALHNLNSLSVCRAAGSYLPIERQILKDMGRVCVFFAAHVHHVHHIRSFGNNEFRNEDSKQEFCGRPRFLEYPILFNGDNKIPNLIINLIGPFNDQIRYRDFNNEQAKNFLVFLMDTAIKLQRFSSRSLTLGNLIDYPLRFCEITNDNIRLEIVSNI